MFYFKFLGIFDLITHAGFLVSHNERIDLIQQKTNTSLDILGDMMSSTCSTSDVDLTKLDLLDTQQCNRFLFSRISAQIDSARRNFISAVS